MVSNIAFLILQQQLIVYLQSEWDMPSQSFANCEPLYPSAMLVQHDWVRALQSRRTLPVTSMGRISPALVFASAWIAILNNHIDHHTFYHSRLKFSFYKSSSFQQDVHIAQ